MQKTECSINLPKDFVGFLVKKYFSKFGRMYTI